MPFISTSWVIHSPCLISVRRKSEIRFTMSSFRTEKGESTRKTEIGTLFWGIDLPKGSFTDSNQCYSCSIAPHWLRSERLKPTFRSGQPPPYWFGIISEINFLSLFSPKAHHFECLCKEGGGERGKRELGKEGRIRSQTEGGPVSIAGTDKYEISSFISYFMSPCIDLTNRRNFMWWQLGTRGKSRNLVLCFYYILCVIWNLIWPRVSSVCPCRPILSVIPSGHCLAIGLYRVWQKLLKLRGRVNSPPTAKDGQNAESRNPGTEFLSHPV